MKQSHFRFLLPAAALAALCLAPQAKAYDITGKVVDSAGVGIADAKVWLQSDSARSLQTEADGSFHFVAAEVGLRPMGAPEATGMALRMQNGNLYLYAPKAMHLTLTVAYLDGRSLRSGVNVSLAPGANRLDKIIGHLRNGAYALSLRGESASLKMRVIQGTASGAVMESKSGRAARGTAKSDGAIALRSAKTSGLPDLNGKDALAVSKAGYSPMLYVPTLATETGVSITLKKPIAKPNHIIVIYLENWSFDAMYGQFPGVEGLTQAYGAEPQKDSNNVAYATLPHPWNTDNNTADSLFPDTLSNKQFSFFKYIGLGTVIPDLVHRFYQEQLQIHGGKMDQFAAVSNARGMTMGYFDTDSLPLSAYAKQYTLCDHFFHSAFGGSYLNHQWLIAARTPRWADIPAKYMATLDSATGMARKKSDRSYADGQATPDGYLINTIYTHNAPHPATAAADQLVPDMDFPTIGDRLNEKGVSWGWYSGGWDSAMVGRSDSSFQFHHQPFAYFKNYADGTPGRAAHLKDEKDFVSALQNGTLPAVSFLKPVGVNNEHPDYTDVRTGELHTMALIEAIKSSSIWSDAVVIVTYDENGGFYDHVAPPVIDRWGPGTRVPTLIISPFAKQNYVDKHTYETVSILSLIERRFGLLPLSSRDAAALDLTAALELPAN